MPTDTARDIITALAAVLVTLAVTVLFAASPAGASALRHHVYTLAGHATTGGWTERVTVRLHGCTRPPVVHALSADGMADNYTVTHRAGPGRNRYAGAMIFGQYDETGTWHITTATCPGRHGTIRISSPRPEFSVPRAG